MIQNNDYGLVRAEEIALNRALYASLREQQLQHNGSHQDDYAQKEQVDPTSDTIVITSDHSRAGSSSTLDNSEDDYSDDEKSYDTSLTTTNVKMHQKSSSDKLTT